MSLLKEIEGKIVLKVENRRTDEFRDDEGFIIHFTDGSRLELEAGMGHATGYIIENFVDTD